MDLQDPKTQRTLFSVLIGGLVLYFYFGTAMLPFSYQAKGAEIEVLEQEHEKLTRELERARLTVGNMEKLEREFAVLHRQWEIAQSLLPEHNEISQLLRKVSASGSQSGLEFVRYEPGARMAQGFYTENPVVVEVEGSYHQVGSFLSRLANLNRIINVRGLYLEGVDPRRQAEDDVNHTVEARMEIVAYTMDKSAAALPADAAASQGLARAGSNGTAQAGVSSTPAATNGGH